MPLVIGLGSMGRRRIRCLQALGVSDIVGFDFREDRCNDVSALYGVPCSTAMPTGGFTHVFICTPPDKHLEYMNRFSAHCFVEHGISKHGLEALDPQWIRPSCTMLFHPDVIKLKERIASGELGKVSNVLCHSGQYLPDWHPHENVRDFYVSKKETGGAREIVPFELTWLVDVFGFPKVRGDVRKTIDIPGAEEIDDTYNCLLDWGSHLGVLTVDVVTRPGTRRLTVVGSEKTLTLDLNHAIKGSDAIYLEETRAFLNGEFPNTLQREISILTLLEQIESASAS